MKKLIFILTAVVFFLSSCKKEIVPPPTIVSTTEFEYTLNNRGKAQKATIHLMSDSTKTAANDDASIAFFEHEQRNPNGAMFIVEDNKVMLFDKRTDMFNYIYDHKSSSRCTNYCANGIGVYVEFFRDANYNWWFETAHTSDFLDMYDFFVDVSDGSLIRWVQNGSDQVLTRGFKMPSFPKNSNNTDGNDVLSSIKTATEDYSCGLNGNFYTFFFRDIDYGGYTFGYKSPACTPGKGFKDLKTYYMTCGFLNHKTWNDRASSAMGYFW